MQVPHSSVPAEVSLRIPDGFQSRVKVWRKRVLEEMDRPIERPAVASSAATASGPIDGRVYGQNPTVSEISKISQRAEPARGHEYFKTFAPAVSARLHQHQPAENIGARSQQPIQENGGHCMAGEYTSCATKSIKVGGSRLQEQAVLLFLQSATAPGPRDVQKANISRPRGY